MFAVNFPQLHEGEFIKLEITSGISTSGGVMDFNIQFMTKANHPAISASMCIELIKNLDLKSDIEFDDGKYQMIVMKASSPQPYYVGVTEKNEFIYSIDFRILVSEI